MQYVLVHACAHVSNSPAHSDWYWLDSIQQVPQRHVAQTPRPLYTLVVVVHCYGRVMIEIACGCVVLDECTHFYSYALHFTSFDNLPTSGLTLGAHVVHEII